MDDRKWNIIRRLAVQRLLLEKAQTAVDEGKYREAIDTIDGRLIELTEIAAEIRRLEVGEVEPTIENNGKFLKITDPRLEAQGIHGMAFFAGDSIMKNTEQPEVKGYLRRMVDSVVRAVKGEKRK